jgi:hypothetical protein
MFKKKSPFENKKGTLLKKETENNITHVETPEILKQEPLKYRKSRNIGPINQTIAFCSTHKGAGCTHLALVAAYELSKTYNTALVELDPTGSLSQFEAIYKLKDGLSNSKKLDQLDIYSYASNNLLEVYKQGYDVIVFDIGCILDITGLKEGQDSCLLDNIQEAYKSSKRVLVTQIREWQQQYLAEFLKHENDIEGWKVITNLTTEKDYKDLVKLFKKEYMYSDILNVQYIDAVFKKENIKEKIVEYLLY